MKGFPLAFGFTVKMLSSAKAQSAEGRVTPGKQVTGAVEPASAAMMPFCAAEGRSKDIGIGQQRNRILRILPQAFERDKQKRLVLADRKTQSSAELLASQRILDRGTGRIGIGRIESLTGLQRLAERKRISRVHGIVTEKP
jgi:hypothetical protein